MKLNAIRFTATIGLFAVVFSMNSTARAEDQDRKPDADDIIQMVVRKDFPSLQKLKDQHFNFNMDSDGISPLEMAGFNCDPQIVNFLLAAGANPDYSSPEIRYRRTPVEAASEPGYDKTLPQCKDAYAILKQHSHDSNFRRHWDKAKEQWILVAVAFDIVHDAASRAKDSASRASTQLYKEGREEVRELYEEAKSSISRAAH